MNNVKKILALVLVAVMMMALSVSAFAAEIEVKSVIDGEEYTAYKILNYTNSGDAYSYYLTADEYSSIGSALEAAGFAFTKSADGTQYVLNNAETVDVAAAAESLATANLGDALGKFTATGASGSATFTGLTQGYYFISTTAGSLCALHSDVDIATAVEKNTITTPDKKQGAEAGTYADTQLDVNIGDTVYYDAEIKIGKGANYEITGTDTLSTGLTLNQDSITVKVAGTEVPATNYTIDPISAQGFTIKFTADYVKTLKEDDVIMIEYSAVVNEKAVIRGDNPNTWTIDYSKQHEDDKTVVKTYDIQVKKVDDNNAFLDGAGFKLYDAATQGNLITVAKDGTGYYVDDTADEEIMIESADGANVRGLAPGTYYLEETTVPDGYNKLSERKAVTVTKDATGVVEIVVENKAGSELPSTGGIGTTIFYIVGALLVVGAGVVLVTRRKVDADK